VNLRLSFSLCFLSLLILGSVFAPSIAPYPPEQTHLDEVYSPPSSRHWFGTDDLGRDLFSRALYGGRISLSVAVVAVAVSVVVGVFFGAMAGGIGGVIDGIIMRLVDVMLAFPTLFLILAVIAFLDPGIINIMIIIGLTSWMGVARLVRAEFLKLKQMDFILSARAQGLGFFRITFFHILPNALTPVLVNATLGMASAILIESGLSFLGLGVQPPTPSWGNMLIAGKDTLEFAWWISLFPGLLILLTVLSLHLVGEWLEERLNPKTKKLGRR
jgi:peptide/nickel transport system permease protein